MHISKKNSKIWEKLSVDLFSKSQKTIVEFTRHAKTWPDPLVSHPLSSVLEIEIFEGQNLGVLENDLVVLTADSEQLSGYFRSLGGKNPAWDLSFIKISNFPLHPKTTHFMANGYQCWSESPLLGINDVLLEESIESRRSFGDCHFFPHVQKPGNGHSWSFSFTQIGDSQKNLFFGSLMEDIFLSAFEFRIPEKSFDIILDTAGFNEGALLQTHQKKVRKIFGIDEDKLFLGAWILPSDSTSTEFQVAATHSSLSTQVGAWYQLLERLTCYDRPMFLDKSRSICGYTSWYYAYNSISESFLKKCLIEYHEEIRNLPNVPFATEGGKNVTGVNVTGTNTRGENLSFVFQIDDGYQKAIGDWLEPAPGFLPESLESLARSAKDRGFKPGIWCAPFLVAANSQIIKKHPEWLLKGEDGKALVCGNHPLWGGEFFAWDTENEEYQDWIDLVFKYYFETCGFEFLKADFLYVASLLAQDGFTRAQRGARAHALLANLTKKYNVTFLSCGSILSQAYGRCHYSRVGPDVGETWENSEFGAVQSREKVSTRSTLINSVTRSVLDGIHFGNDPDVIILRDENQSLSKNQRSLLCEINSNFGSLVFCSDPPSLFRDWQKEQFGKVVQIQSDRRANIIDSIRLVENNYLVTFVTENKTLILNPSSI